MKIAIATSSFAKSDPYPIQLLEQAGVEIKDNPYGRQLTEAEIIEHLDGVDGLIAGLEPLNRRVFESASQLKAIARVGIGIANVDLEAAEEFGIRVSNTPDGPTEAVAEMTITALLNLCRRLRLFDDDMHDGKWQKEIGIGLKDTKVLLIGYGRIGRRTGQLLKAFNAEILVADPFISDDTLEAEIPRVSLKDGLKIADVISLHADGQKTLLGDKEFDQMRDGVILLNSARGELVDEDALIKALDSGKVQSAWFDAFREEPYHGRLTRYKQVLLTPHVCTYTRQCRSSMEISAVRNLLRDLGLKT